MNDYHFKTINSKLNAYLSPYIPQQLSVEKYDRRNTYKYTSPSGSIVKYGNPSKESHRLSSNGRESLRHKRKKYSTLDQFSEEDDFRASHQRTTSQDFHLRSNVNRSNYRNSLERNLLSNTSNHFESTILRDEPVNQQKDIYNVETYQKPLESYQVENLMQNEGPGPRLQKQVTNKEEFNEKTWFELQRMKRTIFDQCQMLE